MKKYPRCDPHPANAKARGVPGVARDNAQLLGPLRYSRQVESFFTQHPGATPTSFVGRVTTATDGPYTIVTRESGSLDGRPASNTYRWTLSPDGSRLNLAHLRFGPNHPVELVTFDLTDPIHHDNGSVEYRSLAPHLCDKDEYHATLTLERSDPHVADLCYRDIVLHWRIIGPDTNQTIVTRYSPEAPAQPTGASVGSHVVKM